MTQVDGSGTAGAKPPEKSAAPICTSRDGIKSTSCRIGGTLGSMRCVETSMNYAWISTKPEPAKFSSSESEIWL